MSEQVRLSLTDEPRSGPESARLTPFAVRLRQALKSLLRRFGVRGHWIVPGNDLERMAWAVLDGDRETALALADRILETYHRTSGVPALPIDWCQLPAPTRRVLLRDGVLTLRDLAARSAGELCFLTGFGRLSLQAVRIYLQVRGLHLRDEGPEVIPWTKVGGGPT
jgi:hypothetical protein